MKALHIVWSADSKLTEQVSFRVRGDCMRPVLADGQKVRVVSKRCYWPGDVVAFVRPNGAGSVHRVVGYRVGISGLSLLTKGDHEKCLDAPVPLNQVLGRHTEFSPSVADRARTLSVYAGYLSRVMRKRLQAKILPLD